MVTYCFLEPALQWLTQCDQGLAASQPTRKTGCTTLKATSRPHTKAAPAPIPALLQACIPDDQHRFCGCILCPPDHLSCYCKTSHIRCGRKNSRAAAEANVQSSMDGHLQCCEVCVQSKPALPDVSFVSAKCFDSQLSTARTSGRTRKTHFCNSLLYCARSRGKAACCKELHGPWASRSYTSLSMRQQTQSKGSTSCLSASSAGLIRHSSRARHRFRHLPHRNTLPSQGAP